MLCILDLVVLEGSQVLNGAHASEAHRAHVVHMGLLPPGGGCHVLGVPQARGARCAHAVHPGHRPDGGGEVVALKPIEV